MIRLVISNQRGGVAKTTTTHTLARYLADAGRRVLMVDTDPQGSLAQAIGATGKATLYDFVIQELRLKDCVLPISPNLDILASNRKTVEMEHMLLARTGREMTFQTIFSQIEDQYDAILFDVAPSISLLQTCALLYCQRILIPLAADSMSWQGVLSALETAKALNSIFKTKIEPVAFLPVILDRRLQMTEVILKTLDALSAQVKIPILPAIRIDASVSKAGRKKQFLIDFDPEGRAIQDYILAFDKLMTLLPQEVPVAAREETQTA